MIKITFPDGTSAEVKTATDATRLLKQFDEGLDPEADQNRDNWKTFDKEIKRRLDLYDEKNKCLEYGKYHGSVPAFTTYIRGLCKLRAAVSGIPVMNYGGRHSSEELDFFLQIIEDILPDISKE